MEGLPVIRSQSAASSKWSFQLPKGGQFREIHFYRA
jgi:hypothetical protein